MASSCFDSWNNFVEIAVAGVDFVVVVVVVVPTTAFYPTMNCSVVQENGVSWFI